MHQVDEVMPTLDGRAQSNQSILHSDRQKLYQSKSEWRQNLLSCFTVVWNCNNAFLSGLTLFLNSTIPPYLLQSL